MLVGCQSNSDKHGYNELANPNQSDYFTVSDYNTDNPEIKNIFRPKVSTVKTELDTSLLFDTWVNANDTKAPHATFDLTKKSFFVVDYDGDGNMPYELNGDKIKIYYNDFIQEGKIVSIDKDTLKILWKDVDEVSDYMRWKY
jgi:hypothetical protein